MRGWRAIASWSLASLLALAAAGDSLSGPVLDRARSEEKPVVVFSRPPDCRDEGSHFDPCEAFEFFIEQPAIRRRLEHVMYLSTEGVDQGRAVTVYDLEGERLIRWNGVPDGASLRRMLNLVDGAADHVIAAFRARRDGDANLAARERVLALFALGHAARGRAELQLLLDSPDEESRELGTIWLQRLNSRLTDEPPDETLLRELAGTGSTPRVRYEAWMMTGELSSAKGSAADAVAAFSKAVELAPAPSLERDVAISMLQRASEISAPIAGLGAPGTVIAGRRTLQPLWDEAAARRVEYRLDGRLAATARHAPFAAAINFGRIPARHELEVVAFDSKERELRSAKVVVNDRANAFAIRIVEPAVDELSGSADVELSVRVPRGRTIQWVVVEWNGRRVARMTSPPYTTKVEARGKALGILRAAIRLDDGSELEDVRLFNAGGLSLESDVHLVEVPVYSKNRHLTADDIALKEDGAPIRPDRVIGAADTPLVVALVLDVSKSMENYVLDLEEAALEFVESLDERDRVMVVAIDSSARVVLWPTSDRDRIVRAIQHLHVKGATALNDGMITGLLQLQSIGSRRAMVVMSDGWDNASVFAHDDVLEVSKRSAVPIYILTLNPRYDRLPTRDHMPLTSQMVKEQRRFTRLGQGSGGEGFTLRSIDKVGKYWAKIADDLRDQSLVIYRPGAKGAAWRKLELSLRTHGALRAPEGVYVGDGGRSQDGEP